MPESPQTPNRRKSLPLLILAAVFVLPLLAALVVFKIMDPSAIRTTNYGTLVHPPRPLEQFQLRLAAGSPFTLDDMRGKWTLVYLLPAACDEHCQASVHKMRQVRWAQGEEMQRVQRLLVVMDASYLNALAAVQSEYPGMFVVTGGEAETAQVAGQFTIPDGTPAADSGHIFIVDPIGNIMMTYPPDADPKGMIKDLERLLKFSQVG